MGTITLTLPVADTEITAGLHATNYTTLQNVINGNLDENNISASALLNATARVGVRKNSAGSVFSRRRLNLIEGTNITLTIADDSVNEEVDITIASTSGIGDHGVKAVRAAAQSITGSTETQVAFNEADQWDTDAYHDPASNNTRLTVPAGQGGKYLLSGRTYFQTMVDANIVAIGWKVNGGGFNISQRIGVGTSMDIGLEFSEVLNLVATDYVEMTVWQNNAGAKNVVNSFLSLQKLA